MNRKFKCVVLGILGFALASFGGASLCTIDQVPAATLLLPYFEIPLDDTNKDVIFSVNNASDSSRLAHMVLWTDMSIEALDFNIYLTGYDVQTVSLGLLIRDGVLPQTSFETSNVGAFSRSGTGGTDYASECSQILPYEPVMDEDHLIHLQSILTGGPSLIYGGNCGGFNYGDNVARGYVTIDNMYRCTLLEPCDEGYFEWFFDGELSYAAFENVLWGDWYTIDYANNSATGDALVHIESALSAEELFEDTGTQWSFYGNKCQVPELLDAREPLGTAFMTRFYQNAGFDGGTDLYVWRASGAASTDGFACGSYPSWFPLNNFELVAFDEQENPETLFDCPVSPCPEGPSTAFPLEAQKISVSDLGFSPESGFLFLNLNGVDGEGLPIPREGWVFAVHSGLGRFSAGLSAVQLDSLCNFVNLSVIDDGDN